MDFLLKYAQYITIIGSLITVLGGYLSYKKSEKDGDATNVELGASRRKTEENIELTKKVQELSQINQHLIESNLRITESNSALAQKNMELSNKINQTAANTKDYVLGTDSYCFIGLNFHIVDNLESAALFLYNTGKNPLTSIRIEIIDSGTLPKDSRNSFDLSGRSFNVDFLSPQVYTTTTIPLELKIADKEVTVDYKISTNNGIYRQISHYRFEKDRWVVNSKYYDRRTNELLFSRTD